MNTCERCGGDIHPEAKYLCRKCYESGGRPRSSEGVYARSIGLTPVRLRRLGGEAKLRSLSPDALAVLLKPLGNGNSQQVHVGGLRARGYASRKRGLDTQAVQG